MLPAPVGGRDLAGVDARRAAVSLLHAVTVLGRPLDLAFDHATRRLPRADDRGLARALAGQALRWLPDLDRLIDAACARPLPADARARQVLRVALAGHLRLGTAPHATIATALAQVEGGPRRLVHAILARLLRTRARLPAVPTLPEPWAGRWRSAWGAEVVDAAARALADVPPLDLALRDPCQTALWAARLGARSLFPGHLRLDGSHLVPRLPGYAEGAWWVQDAAAQLPARLLGAVQGRAVLDACAAPGGKTMQLASLGARVTAVDLSPARMDRLAANLARTGLAARTIVADLLQWEPEAPFDAILLDAPCSATGTFRRHPDVLHLRRSGDVSALLGFQQALCARVAGWLKPGGRLVVAVCSIEPEEGEWQQPLAAALPGLAPDQVRADELPPGLAADAVGAVRTLPGQAWAGPGGADGFHIMRLRAS